MSQATINVRLDGDLKRDVEEVCHAMGMNMTTAFTIYAKRLVSDRRIPFEVVADPLELEPPSRTPIPRFTTVEALEELMLKADSAITKNSGRFTEEVHAEMRAKYGL
jgi:addiction module RelB/DinJ family antitoxin